MLILNKTAGSPLATSLERSYKIIWKLKFKSDAQKIIGEVLYLMDVTPEALRHNT